jgi:hypothetical protein
LGIRASIVLWPGMAAGAIYSEKEARTGAPRIRGTGQRAVSKSR